MVKKETEKNGKDAVVNGDADEPAEVVFETDAAKIVLPEEAGDKKSDSSNKNQILNAPSEFIPPSQEKPKAFQKDQQTHKERKRGFMGRFSDWLGTVVFPKAGTKLWQTFGLITVGFVSFWMGIILVYMGLAMFFNW